ncbi:unnamed protein product [Mortierella alpina]
MEAMSPRIFSSVCSPSAHPPFILAMSTSAQPVRSVDRRFTTTAFDYPGYFVAQAHGVVRGITVRNPNAGKAILGAFASFTGGESSTYIEMAEKARERAFLRMLEHAAAAGGNGKLAHGKRAGGYVALTRSNLSLYFRSRHWCPVYWPGNS